MRLYLDTNILAMLNMGRVDELCGFIIDAVSNYEHTLLASTVCMQELVHLVQIGKVRIPGSKDVKDAARKALEMLDEMGVTMMPVSARHLQALIDLPLYDDHRDPNDRLIVAQAISDRVPLVSSDRKLARYARHGLEFVFNER